MRRLAILLVLSAFLTWRPSMAEDQKAQPSTERSQPKDKQNPIHHAPAVGNPSLTTPDASQPSPNSGQANSAEKPLPRFERPEWVIVYITAFYVGIAWWTLLGIRKQADLMKEQLDVSQQRERPRLRIELEGLDLSLKDSPNMILIDCKINNYGGSIAFVTGGVYGCWVASGSEHRAPEALSLFLPEVILPQKPYEPPMLLADEDEVVDWALWSSDDPRIQSLRNGEASVYLSGFIQYDNIFGETWSLGFKRKFTVRQSVGDFFSGDWSREGGDTYNYERQEILPKSPNPN